MNYVLNHNGKVLEEMLADAICFPYCENNIDTTSTLFQNECPSFSSFRNLPPFLRHFVTYTREYYEWLCRLRLHLEVGRLPVQGTWLGLMTQSDT